MSYQKLLILILFILVFGVGFFSYNGSAQAATFADCPTTYGTLVCGEGQQYCGGCTTGISDNRSPQWTLNCGTCTWSCPPPNVACGNVCGPAYSGENPTCVAKKVTTDQCGNCTTTCRTPGDTYCSTSGSCITPTACPPGTTWNGCACTVNPYILASPASSQDAYIDISGNTKIGGDFYAGSGKAIRVDGSGVTSFNLGNWGAGATGFNFDIYGNVKVTGNTTSTGHFATSELCLNNNCRTTWPSTSGTNYWTQSGSILYPNNLAWNIGIGTSNPARKLSILDSASGPLVSLSGLTSNYRGLSLRRSSDDVENWFTGTNDANSFVIRRNGATNDITVDSTGAVTLSSLSGGTSRCVQSDANGKLVNVDCAAAGSNYWTQSGSILYPNNLTWSIGMGINAPVSRLHLYQNDASIDSSTGMTIEQDGSGDAILQFLLTSLYRWTVGVDNSDNDTFKIGRGVNWATGSDLNITIAGNIGIGTSNPARKLSILDSASGPLVSLSGLTSNYRGLSLRRSSDDVENWFTGTNDANSFVIRRNGATNDITVDSTGAVTLSSLSGGTSRCVQSDANGKLVNVDCATITANSFIQNGNSFGSPAVLGTNDNNSLSFETNNISRVKIDTAGNVGINENAPAAKLEITDSNATVANNLILHNAYDEATYTQRGNSILFDIMRSGVTRNTAKIYAQQDAASSLSGGLTIQTADSANVLTDRLAVISSGNVGIGTVTPNSLLHVYKASGNNAEIDIQSVSGANNHWAIYQERSNGDLRFWNNNNTNGAGEKNTLTIRDEGEVSIGSNNLLPNRSLHVGNTVDARYPAADLVIAPGINRSTNTRASGVELQSITTSGAMGYSDEVGLVLYANKKPDNFGVRALIINNNDGSIGDVGIGMYNRENENPPIYEPLPTKRLDVMVQENGDGIRLRGEFTYKGLSINNGTVNTWIDFVDGISFYPNTYDRLGNWSWNQDNPAKSSLFIGTNGIGVGTESIASVPETRTLEVDGGVRLNTTATKPTCNASIRGMIWFTQRPGLSLDTLEVCMKTSGIGPVYDWRTLNNNP